MFIFVGEQLFAKVIVGYFKDFKFETFWMNKKEFLFL
jgi:hypothetical protein